MTERSFVDTNVWCYAVDPSDPAKAERATELATALLAEGTAVVSTQVLHEVYVTCTRKMGFAISDARRYVSTVATAEVLYIDLATIQAAIDLCERVQLTYWDALLVASAAHAGVPLLYSEDFQAGQTISGVRIANPFA